MSGQRQRPIVKCRKCGRTDHMTFGHNQYMKELKNREIVRRLSGISIKSSDGDEDDPTIYDTSQPRLSAPRLKLTARSGDTFSFLWEPVPGATWYHLALIPLDRNRNPKSGAKKKELYQGPDTTFEHTGLRSGATYGYSIRAKDVDPEELRAYKDSLNRASPTECNEQDDTDAKADVETDSDTKGDTDPFELPALPRAPSNFSYVYVFSTTPRTYLAHRTPSSMLLTWAEICDVSTNAPLYQVYLQPMPFVDPSHGKGFQKTLSTREKWERKQRNRKDEQKDDEKQLPPAALVYEGPQARATIVEGLEPGRDYRFQLRIKMTDPAQRGIQEGYGPASLHSTSPIMVEMVRKKTSIKLAWSTVQGAKEYRVQLITPGLEVPLGGSSEVQFGTQRQEEIVYEGPKTVAMVPKLKAGQEYQFRVKAIGLNYTDKAAETGKDDSFYGVDGDLDSLYSPIFTFSTAPSVPRPPEPVVAVAVSPNSITVGWKPPLSSGAPITEYSLEQADGEESFIVIYVGPTTQYTSKGLHHGNNYRFRVRARNRVGKSLFSPPTTISTNHDVPSPPTSVRIITRELDRLKFQWSPPHLDGGTPLTHYTVEVGTDEKGPFQQVTSGVNRIANMNGLQPNTDYYLLIRAWNQVGQSKPVYACYKTAPGPPCQPLPPQLVASFNDKKLVSEPGDICLKWVVGDDCGSPIGSCSVLMSPPPLVDGQSANVANAADGVVIYQGPSHRCIIPAKYLLPSTDYSFAVITYNKIGASPQSQTITITTGNAPPEPMDAPTLDKCFMYSAELFWKQPHLNGGQLIKYLLELIPVHAQTGLVNSQKQTISIHPSVEENQILEVSHVVQQLEPFTCYQVRVRCVNDVGKGMFSDPIQFVTQLSPPTPPSEPRVVAKSTNSITLEWNGPEKVELPPILPKGFDHTHLNVHYVVEMLSNNDVAGKGDSKANYRTVYEGKDTKTMIDNLNAATSYTYRIQAINSAGTSAFTKVNNIFTSCNPPGEVPLSEFQTNKVTSSQIDLSWGVADSQMPVSYVLFMASEDGHFKRLCQTVDTSYTVPDLNPNTQYSFKVCAHNEGGKSHESGVFKVVTLPPPPPRPSAPRVTLMYSHETQPDNYYPLAEYKAFLRSYNKNKNIDATENPVYIPTWARLAWNLNLSKQEAKLIDTSTLTYTVLHRATRANSHTDFVDIGTASTRQFDVLLSDLPNGFEKHKFRVVCTDHRGVRGAISKDGVLKWAAITKQARSAAGKKVQEDSKRKTGTAQNSDKNLKKRNQKQQKKNNQTNDVNHEDLRDITTPLEKARLKKEARRRRNVLVSAGAMLMLLLVVGLLLYSLAGGDSSSQRDHHKNFVL